jgi:ribosomal protein L11 methyltransferase
MPWLQLQTVVGQQQPEVLELALEALGAVVVSFSDAGNEPILEPGPGETPPWSSTIVAALFPPDFNAEQLSEALAPLVEGSHLTFSIIEDRDWQAEWRSTLEPVCFGSKLWVVPEGQTAPRNGAIVSLSPGMAFGTGEHPTTAMCLEWLDGLPLENQAVLDYGCGSGLLAIAALALGAGYAKAVDIDPQALEATRNNADRNQCLDRLNVSFPEEISDARQYDVLVANILSGTLIKLGPEIRELLAPGARLALAGILAHQATEVKTAWEEWAKLEVSNQIDDWVLLTGQKHGLHE